MHISYKIVSKYILILCIIFCSCNEADVYKDLSTNDKNNNQIIDRFENFIHKDINEDDPASRDLKKLLLIYGQYQFQMLNERDLNLVTSKMHSKKNDAVIDCLIIILRTNKDLMRYSIVKDNLPMIDFNKIDSLNLVTRSLFSKKAKYLDFLHGEIITTKNIKCNLELEGHYEK